MKYVFTDLDGTLLSNEGLKQSTIDACINYQQKNKLIIASGRNETSVQDLCEKLELEKYQGACILANGAILIDYQDQERVELAGLTQKEAKKLVFFAYLFFFRIYLVTKEKRYAYHVLYEYFFYIARYLIKHKPIPKLERVKEFPEDILKIELCPTIFFSFFLCIFKAFFKHQYQIVKVGRYWVEVLPKNTNKANMVQYYLNKYGINIEDVYIFGDGENDIEMLQLTKHSYAMENAEEFVKLHSQFVCESNNHDGVVQIIKNL